MLKNIALLIVSCLLILQTIAQSFGGNSATINWQQTNTANAKLIFPKGYDSLAHKINTTINSLHFNDLYSLGGKTKKWNILLQTNTTIPNAYVRLAPVRSEFYLTPDFDNITSGTLPWAELLTKHEYRHIEQFTNFNNGLTKVFAFLLGQEGQLIANGITIPDYFFEGDAVFQETITSNQGRGQLPSFFSGLKALQLDNKKYSWMKLRSGSYKNYIPNHYELGYQLVTNGYLKYGNDFWKKVVKDATSFKGLFYAYQKAIKKYSGLTYKVFRENALSYFAPNKDKNKEFVQQLKWVKHPIKENISYHFPQIQTDGSIIALKESYKQIPQFIKIINGKQLKIANKNIGIDNYYSTNNTSIVYSTYSEDKRRDLVNYSNITMLDVLTKKQVQLTNKSKYFQPSINVAGTKIVAVQYNEKGNCALHVLNATNGSILQTLPNNQKYIFTYPKFWNYEFIISIIRNQLGENAIVKTNTSNSETTLLTPFTFNAIGYPSIYNDLMYFTIATKNADRIASLNLINGDLNLLTNNENSIFYPSANDSLLLFSVVTSNGLHLAQKELSTSLLQKVTKEDLKESATSYFENNKVQSKEVAIQKNEAVVADVKKYKELPHLFNLHSRRPGYTDPVYSYTFYSENTLNNLQSEVKYAYNKNEKSHSFSSSINYAKYFPVFTLGASTSFNRNVQVQSTLYSFNSAKLYTGFYIPLRSINGQSSKSLTFGSYFNTEQLLYNGIGKNILKNKSFQYTNSFVQFSNIMQQAKMQIYPRFAQSIAVTFRDAMTFLKSKKLVINSNFYFPGLFKTHSIVVNASLQKRDTLSDIFSRTFSYARGYGALSTRSMYKVGFNYHLPLLYPDLGIANILFLQRLRANVFYDYAITTARVNSVLTNIKSNSIGAELYFDGKIWNAFPINIGLRYTKLLQKDLLNPQVIQKWEIILPLDIIPE
jgi:hypothetical protein